MDAAEPTLSSVNPTAHGDACCLLALTLVWHPDAGRIGEQYSWAPAATELAVNRYQPLFRQHGGDGVGLAYAGISRQPLLLQCNNDPAAAELTLSMPTSRMVVEVNGQRVTDSIRLTANDIRAGVMLALGGAVLLCLHWLDRLPNTYSISGLHGVGSAAMTLREQIHQVAHTDLPVLLLGETGTGKEVMAQAIHALSTREQAPLFSVNMAALTDGLAAAELFGAMKGAYTGAQQSRQGWFAQAQNATLFLDEIGNAPASIQPMLLRVLENGSYRPLGADKDQRSNARLIAATDQDLYGASFNQALLRRLEAVVIRLPPLRERREDIGVLLRHALLRDVPGSLANLTSDSSRLASLPFELISAIANFDWPGNIRQLVHVANRIKLAMQRRDLHDWRRWSGLFPPAGTASSGTMHHPAVRQQQTAASPQPGRKPPAQLSEADVLNAMSNNQWYIQGAAAELGISRPSLYKLLQRYTRSPAQIPTAEILAALHIYPDDLARCAAHLKTPTEALRRHLRSQQPDLRP